MKKKILATCLYVTKLAANRTHVWTTWVNLANFLQILQKKIADTKWNDIDD